VLFLFRNGNGNGTISALTESWPDTLAALCLDLQPMRKINCPLPDAGECGYFFRASLNGVANVDYVCRSRRSKPKYNDDERQKPADGRPLPHGDQQEILRLGAKFLSISSDDQISRGHQRRE
jgi:hypothetical protein